MKHKLLVALTVMDLLLFVLFGALLFFPQDRLPVPTPTPTKTPRPTVALTATPTSTVTPTATPDIWELNLFPEYGQVAGMLSELFGDVAILEMALQPSTSLFVIFATAGKENLLVAEIAEVEGTWTVLRVYPVGDPPTPAPAFPGSRES